MTKIIEMYNSLDCDKKGMVKGAGLLIAVYIVAETLMAVF